jgi:hypothetical protein
MWLCCQCYREERAKTICLRLTEKNHGGKLFGVRAKRRMRDEVKAFHVSKAFTSSLTLYPSSLLFSEINDRV